MTKTKRAGHIENHKLGRLNWIRAGVLGANDGVVSMAALLVGLLAADVSFSTLKISGIGALIAGAFSMAIGEYVSVASQSDIEQANIIKETQELEEDHHNELAELAGIYRGRGLSADLSMQVAKELTAHNALEAHLRDELGITSLIKAKPLQAGGTSFVAFSIGGILPFIFALLVKHIYGDISIGAIAIVSLVGMTSLCILGYASAKLGGAPVSKAITRILLGGTFAFIISASLGYFLG